MIFSSTNNLKTNDITGPRFAKAFAWLAAQDLAALEPGRHDIDGDEVFANVMSLEATVPADQKSFEAHRAYTDIHYCIEGTEKIGIAPVSELEPLQPFDEKDDFCLYADGPRTSWVILCPGEFCVTPPEDAHKPACSVDAPAPLKKICFKILVG